MTVKPGVPEGRWWNGLIVPVIFLSCVLPLLAWSGAEQASWGGIEWDCSEGYMPEDTPCFNQLIGNADSWAVLSWTGLIAVVVLTLLYFVQWIPAPEGDSRACKAPVARGIAGVVCGHEAPDPRVRSLPKDRSHNSKSPRAKP